MILFVVDNSPFGGYKGVMSYKDGVTKQQIKNKFVGIRVPFTDEEAQKFDNFLKNSGRKVGAYTRLLILKAMEEENSELRHCN